MQKEKQQFTLSALIVSIYTALITGLLHYLYYFIESMIDGYTFKESLTSLIQGGWFFIVMFFPSWMTLSFILSSISYCAIHLMKKEKILYKKLFIHSLKSLAVTFILILILFVIHLFFSASISI